MFERYRVRRSRWKPINVLSYTSMNIIRTLLLLIPTWYDRPRASCFFFSQKSDSGGGG